MRIHHGMVQRIKRSDIPEHSHIILAVLPSELVANVLLNNVPSLSTIGGMEQLFARDVVLGMARWRYSFFNRWQGERQCWDVQRAASLAALQGKPTCRFSGGVDMKDGSRLRWPLPESWRFM